MLDLSVVACGVRAGHPTEDMDGPSTGWSQLSTVGAAREAQVQKYVERQLWPRVREM
jgi:hypothetical protein